MAGYGLAAETGDDEVRRRDAALRIQSAQRGRSARKERAKQEKAAVKVQAHYHGWHDRKQVKDLRQRKQDDARFEDIQKKRQQRMRRRQEEKDAVREVKGLELDEWEEQREAAATTKLQSKWRQRQAKKQMGQFAETRNTAARKIQRKYRQYRRDGDSETTRSAAAEAEAKEAKARAEEMLLMNHDRLVQLRSDINQRLKKDRSQWEGACPSAEDLTKARQQCWEMLQRHKQLREGFAKRAHGYERALSSAEVTASRESFWLNKGLAELSQDTKVSDFPLPHETERLRLLKEEHQRQLKEARLSSKVWKRDLTPHVSPMEDT